MEEEEDFDYAVNEAAIFFDANRLVVSYGDGRSALMELDSEEERQLIKTVMADPNFWAHFLSSLSAAIKKHK